MNTTSSSAESELERSMGGQHYAQGQRQQQWRPVLYRAASYGAHDKSLGVASGPTSAGVLASPSLASSSAATPSYCTIDRSRLRRRPGVDVNSNVLHASTSTLSRKPPQRTPSLQLPAGSTFASKAAADAAENRTLVHVGGNASAAATAGDSRPSSYIGDLHGLDALRKASVPAADDRWNQNGNVGGGNGAPKSVTIHPDVTEFRYPGN